MSVSICTYSNVAKQGQFFSFIMYKESYLRIFDFFYPKCTLNSDDFFPFLFVE